MNVLPHEVLVQLPRPRQKTNSINEKKGNEEEDDRV
jgi:hypothetical protein